MVGLSIPQMLLPRLYTPGENIPERGLPVPCGARGEGAGMGEGRACAIDEFEQMETKMVISMHLQWFMSHSIFVFMSEILSCKKP